MPWNAFRYPPSMQNLPPPVREKAIEVANALLEQGCEEGKAIRVGIATARKWWRHHHCPGRRDGV